MYKIVISFLLFVCVFTACHHHEHAHNQDKEQGMQALAFTIYTDKTELFLEFKPLVVGKEAQFAAHFTHLGEVFTPYTEGIVTLKIEGDGKTTSVQSNKPTVPGIFRLRMMPVQSGNYRMVFDIKTKDFTDQIILDNIKVYPDEKTALAQQKDEEGDNDIAFLKEQAWKTEFANQPVKKQTFYEIIKTTGQIFSAQGDEMVLTAKTSGIVHFNGNNLAGAVVNSGDALFSIVNGDITENNIDAQYKQSKTNYDKAKANIDRAKELIKEHIISQKEYTERQAEFEIAQVAFNSVAKNYSSNGQKVSASISGFIKNIYTSEGEFVNVGQPLASISQNRKLILRVDMSQKYFSKMNTFSSANFITPYNNKLYSTTELNGRLISYGKGISESSGFIPVNFEIDNQGDIVNGAYVEVYLKSSPIVNALVVPISALIEEQGVFYVYVQTEGESFQKREVKLGASDGLSVQILRGINEGERVVSKGAFQIKLSSASGTLPAHGHEH